MKAAQIKQYGGPDVIEIVDIEKPKIKSEQILVKVYAASINPFDVMVRKGFVAKMTDAKLPMVLGGDIAGVVSEVGANVNDFVVGNKVYGQGSVLAGASGAFAEFVAIPANLVAKMPNNLDFNESAAMVLTGVSAVQALVEHMKLQQDQKVLIHGGAGGIGTVAIQIAKSLGAYVVTTATGDGIEYVKKLGADYVIDYADSKAIEHLRQSRGKKVNFIDFANVISNYDAVFDTVGGEVFEHSFKVLKKGGIMVSMVAKDEKKLADQYNVTVISQFTKVNQEHLNMLTDFIVPTKSRILDKIGKNKGVKPHIDKVFSFDKIKEAFEEQEGGNVLGKIVIEIQNK